METYPSIQRRKAEHRRIQSNDVLAVVNVVGKRNRAGFVNLQVYGVHILNCVLGNALGIQDAELWPTP